MQRKSIINLLLIACLFQSCQNKDQDPVVITDVENEFYINMYEELSTEQRNLRFQVETIEAVDCLDSEINYEYNRVITDISLHILEIQEPPICETGYITAIADVNLGYIVEGLYEINIDLKNTVNNTGKLTVDDQRYWIEMESNNGFTIPNRVLMKVPDASFWGYIHYKNAENKGVADDLISNLSEDNASLSLTKGYYHYFSIASDDTLDILNSPNSDHVKSFLFSLDNKEAITGFLTQYRQSYGESVDIKVMTSDGEVL